jgi:hypothetical protein
MGTVQCRSQDNALLVHCPEAGTGKALHAQRPARGGQSAKSEPYGEDDQKAMGTHTATRQRSSRVSARFVH